MSQSTPLLDEVKALRAEVARLKQRQSAPVAATEQIYIGNYLLARLSQLGVKKMFGVPGDFNLGFLDLVEDHESIDWIGCCNELNASYAADGYARVNSKSIGVLTTTFGVGELSAMNGIAGAFSEHVPVLHIAGVPSTTQFQSKPILHHTLGDGRFDAYEKAAEQFTLAQAYLVSKSTAPAEIDRVLTECVRYAKPVYMTLPTDLVYEKVSAARLHDPLPIELPPNDADVENAALEDIRKAVDDAQGDVVILIDACAIRHHVREETAELARKTGFPVYCAPMGKTAISEEYERYGGIYVGSLTHDEIKEKVEGARLILSVGALKSDFNTGNFTYHIPPERTIELHSTHVSVRHAVYPDVRMKRLLPRLTAHLEHLRTHAETISVPRFHAPVPQEAGNDITHDWLWPRVGEFLRKGDVVLAETGTSSFGMLDVPFPEGAMFLTQILWGSIGWTVGSTLGAACAARDLGLGRVILFVGDGSLQLTVQEISTMIRLGLKPILFVLNNSGYTIERHLHGRDRKYNDIANWKWTALLSTFQGTAHETGKSHTVRTKEELSALLDDAHFASAEEIQLVEVMMDKYDAPRSLRRQAELSGKTNKYAPEP